MRRFPSAVRGVYPIVDVPTVPAVAAPAVAAACAHLGVGVLQLRAKQAADRALWRLACEVGEALRGTDVMLVLNDRVDLLLALRAWLARDGRRAAPRLGVHLGQDDLPPDVARGVLDSHHARDVRVGWSTHTERQVAEALRSRAACGGPDHVGFGPIWVTGTKADPEPAVGLAGLQRAAALARGDARAEPLPIVAIGGVTPAEAPSVWDAGAAATAMVAALFAGLPGLDAVTPGAALGDRARGELARRLASVPAPPDPGPAP